MGKYKVPHFDAKGEADHFFTDAGVPTTFLLTSFYWDNFIHFGMGPKKGPTASSAITLPMGDKKLPGIAAEDIGKCAYGIFKRGREFIGKTVGIAGEHLTGAADGRGASPRRSARKCATTRCRPRCTAASDSLAPTTWATCSSSSAISRLFLRRAQPGVLAQPEPGVQSFDTWLERNKDRIPLECEAASMPDEIRTSRFWNG